MYILDISQLKKQSFHPILSRTSSASSPIENPDGMKVCIKTFEASVLDLFKDKKNIKSLLIAPESTQKLAIYLSKDIVYFMKDTDDQQRFQYVIDFKQGSLKSKTSVLYDLHVLDRLIHHFEKLIKGLSNGSSTLFEGQEAD
ncbi:hypothetical protein HOH45_04990 [bacterium]|jgi:hypothetical protein|nr:hypothetical protein [bacterium]